MALTVLVAGASGFVGSPLATALVEAGHRVKAMTRKPDRYHGAGEPVQAAVGDPASLRRALVGVDAAYYLVHSLDDDDFEAKDAAAATAFGRAAAEAGVQQIVYLGGLGADGADLSAHLRSRREVEVLLGEAGVPVTVLRAAIVVGAKIYENSLLVMDGRSLVPDAVAMRYEQNNGYLWLAPESQGAR